MTCKWKTRRCFLHHFHCTHLQFFIARKRWRNWEKMCEISIISFSSSTFCCCCSTTGVIYLLKRYVFVRNLRGNFQHHPIFIIPISTLLYCAREEAVFCTPAPFLEKGRESSICCIRKMKLLSNVIHLISCKIISFNASYFAMQFLLASRG